MREIFNSIVISPLDCYVCFSKFNFVSHSLATSERDLQFLRKARGHNNTFPAMLLFRAKQYYLVRSQSTKRRKKNASNDKSKHGDALDLEAQSLFPIVNLVIILKRKNLRFHAHQPSDLIGYSYIYVFTNMSRLCNRILSQ